MSVMANTLEYDIIVSKLKLQSCYYIHFHINTLGKDMNSFIPPTYRLNSIIAVLLQE